MPDAPLKQAVHSQMIAAMKAGQWSDAQARLEQVLSKHPENAQAHNLMGMVMTEAQRPAIGEFHYRRVLARHEGIEIELRPIERFRFYDFAKSAYAVVATGETAIYANLILKKGVVIH